MTKLMEIFCDIDHFCKVFMPEWDKAMLFRSFIIETINDQLKNIIQIENSRHLSVHNFMLNIFAGLIAYSLKSNKPSLKISRKEFDLIVVVS